MTESEAYDLALEYMRKNNVTHFGLKRKVSWCNRRDVYLGLNSTGFPKGHSRKVWYFTFALEEPPPPNVIVSGGDYCAVVDDETGICGHFFTL
jgi:hypothetical protein